MMSLKQWFVLLCVFLGYVLFGATVFYTIESKQEVLRLAKEHKQMHFIEDLIKEHYVPSSEHTVHEIFHEISSYCDKPLGGDVPHTSSKLTWTFYHSVFFVLTVISTIGYGNLSPTTPFTRTFIIIYGIVGIPINGIVVITLGDFFGRTFLKLYKRWKNLHIHRALATLGLIGQIILYAIPGFTLLIMVPALIIVLYENWSYDLAIEFAFATLTTIGVGHLIPGTNENDHGRFLFLLYKTFLLLWIIVGLGYLAMVFGFISRGLRSKQMQKLEHKIARNIKKTNRKIRQELRALLNEYLLMEVKPIYRERRRNAPIKCQRTQSCPDLTYGKNLESLKIRKRAVSELPKPSTEMMSRRQSDSDLQDIDKDKTFLLEDNSQAHNQLLIKVVNALSKYNTMACSTIGTEETDTCLESDCCEFTSPALEPMRPRSATESRKDRVPANINVPWLQRSAGRRMQESREREKYGRARSRTLPPIVEPHNLFTRLKNTFRNPKETEKLNVVDIEKQAYNTTCEEQRPVNKDHLLEETSLADFLRALTVINFREVARPRRELGTANPAAMPRVRRLPITPVLPARKTSLMPLTPSPDTKLRRFSLNPVPVSTSEVGNVIPLAERKGTLRAHTVSANEPRNISGPRRKSVSFHKMVDNNNKSD